jgi:hypothetical protein
MHKQRQKCTQNLIGNPKQMNQFRIPRFGLHNIIKIGVSETGCEFLSVGGVLTEYFENSDNQLRSIRGGTFAAMHK